MLDSLPLCVFLHPWRELRSAWIKVQPQLRELLAVRRKERSGPPTQDDLELREQSNLSHSRCRSSSRSGSRSSSNSSSIGSSTEGRAMRESKNKTLAAVVVAEQAAAVVVVAVVMAAARLQY